MSGSSGEVHLFAFLTVLVIGGLSGLFMILLPSPLREIGFIMPFRHLFDALLYGWGFSPPPVTISWTAYGNSVASWNFNSFFTSIPFK